VAFRTYAFAVLDTGCLATVTAERHPVSTNAQVLVLPKNNPCAKINFVA